MNSEDRKSGIFIERTRCFIARGPRSHAIPLHRSTKPILVALISLNITNVYIYLTTDDVGDNDNPHVDSALSLSLQYRYIAISYSRPLGPVTTRAETIQPTNQLVMNDKVIVYIIALTLFSAYKPMEPQWSLNGMDE